MNWRQNKRLPHRGCFSLLFVQAAVCSAALVHETPREFIADGDFDGDGQTDLVIVDKPTGKYRLGYQVSAGLFKWVDPRRCGIEDLTGLGVGRLLATNRDALVFASAYVGLVHVVDASPTATTTAPMLLPLASLGPDCVVPVDIAGMASDGIHGLYVATIYNSDPTPNSETLFRNNFGKLTQLSETTVAGVPSHGNRIPLGADGTGALAVMLQTEKGTQFRLERPGAGKPIFSISAEGLPEGSDYAQVRLGKSAVGFVFFKRGEADISLRAVEDAGSGKLKFGDARSFKLDAPVGTAIGVEQGGAGRLLVMSADGKSATLYALDGDKPAVVQSFESMTNTLFTAAVKVPGGFVATSLRPPAKESDRYQVFTLQGGKFVAGSYGSLPPLEADDDSVPTIRQQVIAATTITNAADMRTYTNNIPGTEITYGMVPIPGGEFLMGSSEKGRKADEGPQHKVKVSPFWMGQFEVTWNEYELFMYPEQEKKISAVAAGDGEKKISDAVTRPSKPYTDMTFGMGKQGYPAISMTQHGANKFCHWLSAKTGHFYRLPTEAEWEYACRAGTTTAYFFGDDVRQLKDFGWFEDNADFKYQKVGRKKPNPWGLYDMYGNVVEWVLDQYDPEYYGACEKQGLVVNPWNRATRPYPHSVRGGSYDDGADACRSAARRGSARAWKMQDPQLPKSIWYHSDAPWVGFRLVRPLEVPSADDMVKYWTSGVQKD